MESSALHTPLLFTPVELRGVRPRNRTVLSPMCVYAAKDGAPGDFLLSHLLKFAAGGFGIVFTEATAVEARGRISHGDLGIWTESQVAPLSRLAQSIREAGAAPGIQLAHAGHKAGVRRPWEGNCPLGEADAARGEPPWRGVGPGPRPAGPGWPPPSALDEAGIRTVQAAFREAARRAAEAGFEVLEIHGAHGYLIHQFLSPLTNRRNDGYGGDRMGRMRLALEIVEQVREEWPKDRPLFFRCSVIDGMGIDGVEVGWGVDDSVVLAKELASRGVDVIDCSSGGIAGLTREQALPRTPGFQAPLARQLRERSGIKTMAVGLITEAEQAERILKEGSADLVALGREALYNPNWPLHAARELGADDDFRLWPPCYGWWLERRARTRERGAES